MSLTKTIHNSPQLREWLRRCEHTIPMCGWSEFKFDAELFAKAVAQIASHHPRMSTEQLEMRAARMLLDEGHRGHEPLLEMRQRVVKHASNRGLWQVLFALIVIGFLLLFAVRGHAQQSGNRTSGITLELKNQGTTQVIRGGGLVRFNCFTNLSCTYDAPTLTWTLTSTGGGGTGCTLQGGTNLLLYDTSTTCNDITKWQTNGTTTLSGLATAILDLSAAATFKPPQATAPTVEGTSAFNTTTHLPVWGFNGASTATIPKTLANVLHKWINSYDQTTGTLTSTQPDYGDLTGVPSTFAPTAHNILSASHGDTTAAAAVRGDAIFAIGATPTWQRLGHSAASGGYYKWNGTDMVASTGAASGVGTPTACTNQVVTGFTLNADAAPTSTCHTVVSGDTSGTFAASAHNLLSATHGDTTTGTVARGDLVTGQGASPTWTRLAKGAASNCLQMDGSAVDILWAACPGGSAAALSGITAATTNNTIASGNNSDQIWNWALTTNNHAAFTFGETTAATSGTLGNQYILKAVAIAGSTAVPFNVTSSLTGTQVLPTLHITPTWNVGTSVVDAAILVNVTNTASGATSKLIDAQVGGVTEFNVDRTGAGAFTASVGTGTQPSCTVGTGGTLCQTEGTRPTTAANVDQLTADSTLHDFVIQPNGLTIAAGAGLVQHSLATEHLTAQTATKAIRDICASTVCNQAGMYAVEWSFNQGGTACSSVTAGGVTFALTWTDNNGNLHSAQAIGDNDLSSTTALVSGLKATTNNATAGASGVFRLWSNGSAAIRLTNTYTACTTGTLTWELATTVSRLM